MTKYNLGCGDKKIDGFINVDKYEVFNPDKIIDLEKFPWDIETSSANTIILNHVLEHLGETTDIFINIMKELYRISKPFAKIHITVPHPYSYNFIVDLTHVRKITEETLMMFSKDVCKQLEKRKDSTTKLAYIHNVDFSIIKTDYILNKDVCEFLVKQNLIPENFMGQIQNNVYQTIFMNMIDEIYIQLSVKKYG
jgi:hypothetical protein